MAAISMRLHLLAALVFLVPTLVAAQSCPLGGALLGYARYVVDTVATAAEEDYDYIVVRVVRLGACSRRRCLCPEAATCIY